jgi:bifunctional UDP-N-acetylglucosamine pyrophosphorylase/glucosamine-1-phosphate N-acetyltransferase
LNPTVIVLAAGQGTRMKSDLPKVLHPVAGRPMVQYVVDTARALDPVALAVVIGEGAELVRQTVGEGVIYVVQDQRLGTGHAVQQAEAQVAGQGKTVLVLYGDTPLVRPETLRQMVAHHGAERAAVTILTFGPSDPEGYGRIVRQAGTGEVLAIVEQGEATPQQRSIGEVNSGILCFEDAWLWSHLAQVERRPGGEFYLTDLVAMARDEGLSVAALQVAEPLEVMGIDHRAKLAQAEAEMRRRINQALMLRGVTLIDPQTTYIETSVEIGADTIVWPNTLVQGKTHIGQRCTVGPGSVIRDSTIGDDCRVEMSVVEQAVMEAGSDVGPFGHLRKGARLGAGAHMGNFGELKNTHLGPGAKMGHFSYLGDAEVGAEANIGAGTITCNYDGQRKHRTIIGPGAFVGSDTMLVAPVEIGEGARTGAGAVVTSDVPAGSLAYGVPARVRTSPEDQPGSGKEESEEE